MAQIIKYEECSGGNHITVHMDDGTTRNFDKSEFFVASERDEARDAVGAAIFKQGASSKEQTDWTAVKSELEKK